MRLAVLAASPHRESTAPEPPRLRVSSRGKSPGFYYLHRSAFCTACAELCRSDTLTPFPAVEYFGLNHCRVELRRALLSTTAAEHAVTPQRIDSKSRSGGKQSLCTEWNSCPLGVQHLDRERGESCRTSSSCDFCLLASFKRRCSQSCPLPMLSTRLSAARRISNTSRL